MRSALELMLAGLAREISGDLGPVKWCKRCGRKHPRRAACPLVSAAVPCSDGKLRTRLVHKSRAPES